ncbi:DUF4139 domain-containing protein, partial [Kitasatospora nipponensis]|uniref:DUF4139 domain-containing protein n=1 Tax=Kitasatospora nipponensis TaxID=258049 RepID=UPI0031DA76B3
MTLPAADIPSPPDWPSVLDSVVVHASGAVCRRLAHGPLPAPMPATTATATATATSGPGPVAVRIRLTGLPRSLDPSSLRASLPDAPPGWRVTEVRPTTEALVRTPAELPELRRELAEAEDRLEALDRREELLSTRRATTSALKAVRPPQPEDAPLRPAPVDAVLALADFVEDRLEELHGRLDEVRRQREEAEHTRDLLQERLRRTSDASPAAPVETSAVALVTLTHDAGPAVTPETTDAPTGHPLTIELEYRVPAARWVPAYQLEYRQGQDHGRLVLRAAVAQRTGEDWTGVRLGLSTADLHRPAELPALRSIRIGRRQPAPPPSGWREPPAGLSGLFTGYDSAGAPPAPSPRPRAAAPYADNRRTGSFLLIDPVDG